MKLLEVLAQASAVLAGLLLTGITLMTCVSLVGRNTTGWTLVGDFELTAYAAGAAIAGRAARISSRRSEAPAARCSSPQASDRTNTALATMIA